MTNPKPFRRTDMSTTPLVDNATTMLVIHPDTDLPARQEIPTGLAPTGPNEEWLALMISAFRFGGVLGQLSLPKCNIDFSMLLCTDGDSTTVGQGATSEYESTNNENSFGGIYAASETTGKLKYVNIAAGGAKLAGNLGNNIIDRASTADALIAANPSYANYVLSILIGANDGIFPGSDTAYNSGASWISQLRTYLTARRNAGWDRIVVTTLMPQRGETTDNIALRNEANTRIRALVTDGYADAVIDFARDPILGNVGSLNPAGGLSFFFHNYVHQSRQAMVRCAMVAASVWNAQAVNAPASDTVAQPTFSPPAGTYTSAQSVTISTATSGATIYYTVDGSTPTTSSTVYSGAITVGDTKTVKALAVKSGMTNSIVASAAYTINLTLEGAYWNVNDIGSTSTLSSDRRKATIVGSGNSARYLRLVGALTGKVVIELNYEDYSGSVTPVFYSGCGIVRSNVAESSDVNGSAAIGYVSANMGSYGADRTIANFVFAQHDGSTRTTIANGSKFFIAVDFDSGKGWTSIDGTDWSRSYLGDPATGAGPHFTFTPGGTWYFFCRLASSGASISIKTPETYSATPPAGYTVVND